MAGDPSTYVSQSGPYRVPTEQAAARVREHFPTAWTKCQAPGDDGEYNQRVAWECQQAGIPAYLNGKRGDPHNMSHDILVFENPTGARDVSGRFAGLELIDFIPSHESPAAGFGWGDVTVVPGPPPSMPDGYAIQPTDLGGGGTGTPHGTELGISLFWAHAGQRAYLEQFTHECDYAANVIGATFARWFLTVGGDLFEGCDPWEDCGAFFDRPDHEAVAHQTLETLKSFGLKSHLVLVGSRAQADTDAQRSAIVQRAAHLIRGNEQWFKVVETHNEYEVNQSESHDCRNMARELRGLVPAGFPIALSSPTCLMGGNASASEVQAEIDKLYGGDSGANVLTEHNTRPEPIWNPETLCALGLTLPILSGEPRGPGASAGGDVSDPAVLDADYQCSIRGGAIGHVYHPLPGIWGGHCHPQWPQENRWTRYDQVPNAEAIASTLKARSQSATAPGPGPGPTPGGDDVQPYPDEQTWWPEYEQRIAQLYQRAGQDIPPAVWSAGRWFARPGHTSAAEGAEQAKRHLDECADALGVPRLTAEEKAW